jgi:hypothetical protein
MFLKIMFCWVEGWWRKMFKNRVFFGVEWSEGGVEGREISSPWIFLKTNPFRIIL